jgi:hypothetical protein
LCSDRGPPDDRRFIGRAVHRGIDARAENVGVDSPGATEHKPCNCSASEEILRNEVPGRLLAGRCRKAKRTGTDTHSPCARNSSTSFLCDAAIENSRCSISQRRGASLRRLLVKCGLNAGRYEAREIEGNFLANYPVIARGFRRSFSALMLASITQPGGSARRSSNTTAK